MWLESIQRVIDYIEDHLEDSLDLNVLTRVAQMQTYPLQRTFSLLAMMTLPEIHSGATSDARCPTIDTDGRKNHRSRLTFWL